MSTDKGNSQQTWGWLAAAALSIALVAMWAVSDFHLLPVLALVFAGALGAIVVSLAGGQRERKQELHRQQAEVKALGESLGLARSQLQEANRRQDEILATLSHELRNPLSTLRSSLYVLQRAEPGGEQARRMMSSMDRQIDQLASLGDDLLDASQMGRGEIVLRRSTIDLCAVARAVVEDNRALFARKSLGFVVDVPDEPLLLRADPDRLAGILGNLLDNAAQFTPPGGEVRLKVDREPAGDRGRVVVRDSGAGIEAELLPRIFEPFVQGDRSLAHSQGGLGLGLARVKCLVELHGGTVQASSDGQGRGATFTVELPLGGGENERVPPPAKRARRRVLVIEDNVDGAESLRAVLELLGHVVETAADGRAGVSRAREFLPEVVFCDIGLPVLDGFAVARALREEVRLRGALLVAMTGYARSEDRRRAAEAGFHDHLAKPPSIERLEEVLARAAPLPTT